MNVYDSSEVFCEIATLEQLDEREWAAFEDHWPHCSVCRDRLRELLAVGERLRLDAAIPEGSAPMRAGSLKRFRTRAIREGLDLRSYPGRPIPSYVMAMTSVVFVIVAALVYLHGQSAAKNFTASSAERSIGDSLPTAVAEGPRGWKDSKVVRARSMRRGPARRAAMARDNASETVQPAAEARLASYILFEPQSVTRSSVSGYPALSPSQMSRLDFFRTVVNSSSGVTSVRPVDLASAGRDFDFSEHIRQLHFQLSNAQ